MLVVAANGDAAPARSRGPALKVDRVVVLMRHGVRPPTKALAMPAGVADGSWPDWPVKPGYLTPHGAAAVALAGGYDRARWIAAGLLDARGCPAASAVRIVADSDQRTIATGRTYADALLPGCAAAIEHRPQDEPDPIFSPVDEGAAPIDPTRAAEAVAAALPRGIAAEEMRLRPLLTRLDAILCAQAAPSCGVGRVPTSIVPATAAKRPKLTGALDRASTAAQILLLEYAEGKPMAEVGWGRATPADVARLSEFHSVEFAILARPRYLAQRNLALLAPLMSQALTATAAPRVTMIAGHDTNVASLGGLLGLHWRVPGLAADDPSPGGAIILERLRDGAGNLYVRARFRSQTIDQIRRLSPSSGAAPYDVAVPIDGCRSAAGTGVCTLRAFNAKLATN
ncbi:MAG: histidine-type phosphatase [Sphingomonas sp.]|nr:histidine-type phosphatase [Sphingomonas sp.]